MDTNHGSNGSKCCCPCHKMIGILVAILGVIFLLHNTGVIEQNVFGIAWPIAVILLGLKKTFGQGCKCCSGPKE